MNTGELVACMAGFVSLLGLVMLAASARIQQRNAVAAASRIASLAAIQRKEVRVIDDIAVDALGARLAAESAAEILGRSTRKSWV